MRGLWLVPAIALTAILLVPRVGDRWFRAAESVATRLARSRWLIPTIGLAAIATRLALLPILPVPVPSLHDEFSYLLAADTFAHARLANPPHPMWVFLDTFHVLQHPTYASKYPPAPGALLALGQVLGHPWLGSLLGLGLMCMAVTWMLRGWFPPVWALVGGTLFLLHVGLFQFWVDGYYGGAVPVIGAALVLGSYPRILASLRARDAISIGVGAALLAGSRPVEGFLFCLPLAIALPIELIARKRGSPRVVVRRVVLPALAVLAGALLFLAYYNEKVTHDALTPPHLLYHREYYNYPVLAGQPPGPPLHYDNPHFDAFFNGWQRGFDATFAGWIDRAREAASTWWRFFAGPAFAIPLFALPWALRDRGMRLLSIQFAVCAAGLLSVVWFLPHYAAPLSATWLALIVGAMVSLRRCTFHGWRVGVVATRLVAVLALDAVLVLVASAFVPPGWYEDRARILASLESSSDRHLVLVHYEPGHDPGREWVYNAADVDRAKVVWAREIAGRDLAPLLDYFRDRTVWRLEADAVPPRLSRVSPP